MAGRPIERLSTSNVSDPSNESLNDGLVSYELGENDDEERDNKAVDAQALGFNLCIYFLEVV